MAGGGVSSKMMIGNFIVIKGSNLGYDMMCESVNSDQEEKEGDVLNGNRIINLKDFITNIDIFGVQRVCTGEGTTDKIRRGTRRRKLH